MRNDVMNNNETVTVNNSGLIFAAEISSPLSRDFDGAIVENRVFQIRNKICESYHLDPKEVSDYMIENEIGFEGAVDYFVERNDKRHNSAVGFEN